jgi:hypothetical protein
MLKRTEAEKEAEWKRKRKSLKTNRPLSKYPHSKKAKPDRRFADSYGRN